MNQEWKVKWVDALRSGEFEQGTRVLRFDEDDHKRQFCCLGVLAELSGQRYDHDAQTLPWTIARQVGLPCFRTDGSDAAFQRSRNIQVRLAKMNDIGKSFAEIADWIEKHL